MAKKTEGKKQPHENILTDFAPKILGGNDGYPICMGPGPELMKECVAVKNIKVRQFEDDVMIEGYIANH